MKLLWCRYRSKGAKDEKHTLVLELGSRGNKVHCLVDDNLQPGERSVIRNASKTLDGMNLEERVEWLKNNVPSSIKSVRTLDISRLDILKTYDVQPNSNK